MKKLLLLILLLPSIALAHDKPKPPPQQESQPAPKRTRDSTHDVIRGVGYAALIYGGVKLYQHVNESVSLKKAETSAAPMLVYERRF